MTKGTVVGFFKWTVTNGKLYHSKYIVEGESTMKDTKAYWEFSNLAKHALDASEWELSLDELAKRYPAPADWSAIMERKRSVA